MRSVLRSMAVATVLIMSGWTVAQDAKPQISSRRVTVVDYSDGESYGSAAANDLDQTYRSDANSSGNLPAPQVSSSQSTAPPALLPAGAPGTMPCSYCPCPPIPYIPYSSQLAPSAPQNFPCSYAPSCDLYCGQPVPSCPWPCGPINPYCHQCIAPRRMPVHQVGAWLDGPMAPIGSNSAPGLIDNGNAALPIGGGGSGPADGVACDCGTCGNGNCNCDGGPCGCQCNNSCGCNCCEQHKCHPLIHIDECNPLCCCDETPWHLLGNCCWLKEHCLSIYGWVDAGIMGNGRLTDDRFNGPLTFSDRRGEGEMNQLYLVMERPIDKDNGGFALGGRVDCLYGTDYYFTTAAGLDGRPLGNIPRWDNNNFLYGAALPQMYVETAWDDIRVKLGHFYTIIGYEVVPAIGNFFYSHSYTQQYGEPFTHTGVLASQPLNDHWFWSAGVVDGWNTFNTDDRANFLGGLTFTDKDWGSLAFAITTGGESIFGPGVGPFANRTMYSLVWSRSFTSRFTYVLQHDYGNQSLKPFDLPSLDWYGINQYLLYRINCCWSAGLRIEWFRDDDGYRVTGLRPGNAIQGASFPGNFYECTLGLNYKPNANLAVRPEVRWDWYHGLPNQNPGVGATFPYDAGTRTNQFTYGLDLVYQF